MIDQDPLEQWLEENKDAIAKLAAAHEKTNSENKKSAGELPSGWHRNLDPDELDIYTRTSGNTVLLVRHLRRVTDIDATLPPVLTKLIADVLDGKCKATKKRFTAFDRKYLNDLCATAKLMIEAGDPKVLALVGMQYPPDTKGALSAAALKLAAEYVGLTPRAFKDRINPSSKRGKRG